MNTHLFSAGNLPDAMAKVREKLGKNATIVSWKDKGTGIEVTAMAQSNAASGFEEEYVPKQGTAPRYDIFLAEEELARKAKANNPNQKPITKTGVEVLVKPKAPAKQPTKAPVSAVASVPKKAIAAQSTTSHAQIRPKLHPLVPLLVNAGMELKNIKNFAKYLGDHDVLPTLIEILEAEYSFAPIDAAPSQIIALVGPAGSGKTINCAKLAARALAAESKVLAISTDTERQGGADQLRGLMDKLGAGYTYADNLTHAKNLAQRATKAGQVVLIDTPASGPHEPSSMRFTSRLIDEIGAEGILCLPCDKRADDIEEICAAYFEIGISRAILTRLDLTKRRAGVLLGLANKKLAIAHLSPSPYISGGLSLGTAHGLAKLIIEPW